MRNGWLQHGNIINRVIRVGIQGLPELADQNNTVKSLSSGNNRKNIFKDIHIKHNRPDIIILNKQQKQAHLLDIAVPNSHNITQTYNTKINKYLELSVAMRNLWCLEKISILPLVISATGIVPQSLFKNLKILDLDNTLVVEIQKGILLYSCHIVRKFLNIDTEHNTQQSQNAEARRR
jgi:hypothetical protein